MTIKEYNTEFYPKINRADMFIRLFESGIRHMDDTKVDKDEVYKQFKIRGYSEEVKNTISVALEFYRKAILNSCKEDNKMKCNICGADTMSCSDGTYICSKGHINIPTYAPKNCDMPLPQGSRYGWICPRCGKVNSPDTRSCDCTYSNTIETGKSTLEGECDGVKVSHTGTIIGTSSYETHLNTVNTVDSTDSDGITGKYNPAITLRNNE